jgi:hypothetical protein
MFSYIPPTASSASLSALPASGSSNPSSLSIPTEPLTNGFASSLLATFPASIQPKNGLSQLNKEESKVASYAMTKFEELLFQKLAGNSLWIFLSRQDLVWLSETSKTIRKKIYELDRDLTVTYQENIPYRYYLASLARRLTSPFDSEFVITNKIYVFLRKNETLKNLATPLFPKNVKELFRDIVDINLIQFFNKVWQEIINEKNNKNLNFQTIDLVKVENDLRNATLRQKASNIRKWIQQNKMILAKIRKLDLNERFLTILPQEMENLTGLQRLSLVANYLSELPENIGILQKIKNLTFRPQASHKPSTTVFIGHSGKFFEITK